MPSVPADRAAVTPGWLTDVLQRAGGLPAGAAITAISWQATSAGLSADSARVLLTLKGADAPTSLFIKLSATRPALRKRPNTQAGYAREVRFYRHLQPLVDLRTPRCWHADLDPASGYHVLVLEDLSPAVSPDIRAGVPVEQARTAIAAMARFHARWWHAPQLDQFAVAAMPDAEAARLLELHEQWWPAFLAQVEIPARMRALGISLGAARPRLLRHLFERAPQTLVHRDFGAANMLFAGPDGGVPFAVIDWQTARPGRCMWDVAYFLCQSVTTTTRRELEAELIENHTNQLRRAGIHNYPHATALQDYRLGLLLRYCALISTIAAMPFSREAIDTTINCLLPRCLDAIADHDAGALLEDSWA